MKICRDCGYRENSTDNMPPCPKCGSTVYDVEISIQEGLQVSDQIEIIPSILLQSVIIPVAKTSEGTLIEVALVPWFEIIRLIVDDPKAIFQIKPRRWEEIVAAAYEQAGFDEVILTPHSGDLGRDIIAIKKGVGEVRIIDQVKAYKAGHLVTANDVRALMGILQTDGASKGFLTTTSDFAPRIKDDPLITPLIPKQLDLINGEQLVTRLQEIANRK